MVVDDGKAVVVPPPPPPPVGVTPFDGADAGPVPAAFDAVTVNVYAVPFVSPGTMTLVALAPALAVIPPGADVAVNPVIGLPPLDAGGVHETVAEALPAAAVTPVGAPGTLAGVTLFDADEAGPVPTLFVAVTVNV
jgi:hypothetical protein